MNTDKKNIRVGSLVSFRRERPSVHEDDIIGETSGYVMSSDDNGVRVSSPDGLEETVIEFDSIL